MIEYIINKQCSHFPYYIPQGKTYAIQIRVNTMDSAKKSMANQISFGTHVTAIQNVTFTM